MSRVRWPVVWLRLRCWAEESWGRHVSQRELYRLLDHMRAECKALTAWVDELTEDEHAALLAMLAERVRSGRVQEGGAL